MVTKLLENLREAIRARNRVLAERLIPGLPEVRIRRALDRAKVQGAVEPIVRLFSWKNGSALDSTLEQMQASPFPGSLYMFMDLEMMLSHFKEFKECSKFHPKYGEITGRYFPMFWDGSDNWLALDLNPSCSSRIVLLETESEEMVREAYASFEDFLHDAIRANRQNQRLACFEDK